MVKLDLGKDVKWVVGAVYFQLEWQKFKLWKIIQYQGLKNVSKYFTNYNYLIWKE